MVHYIETDYRRISTPIPHPEDLKVLEELRKVEANGVPKQLPIWFSTSGCQVYDNHNNKFLDFTSGIFVANMGHSNNRINEAIRGIANYHSYSFLNQHRIRFLKKLIEITPAFAEKACLFSTGTEAVEAAVNIIQEYGLKKGNGKTGIVSFLGAMHGNSYLAKRLSGWIPYKHRFSLKHYDGQDGFSTIQTPNIDINTSAMLFLGTPLGCKGYNNYCGFMIESYQGWSGRFYPKDDIQFIVDYAHKHKMLVCFDEIQGGFGRTGKMFAYEHYDIEPDLVCLGKGLTGSLPVSAVMGRAKYMDCLPEGELSSTHSGNPVGCAAGLANLEEFSKNDFQIVEKSRISGIILHNALNDLKNKYPNYIVEINGKGLLAAIITKTKEQSDRVCELAKQRGLLLVHTGRESIKIGPPLTIPVDALIEGVGVIDECFGGLIND